MLDTLQLDPFTKLDKDLKHAAYTLTPNEARYLVDAYYQVQDYRIRFGNQIRALSEAGEPHDLIRWMHSNAEGLEKNIQKALDAYSKAHEVGRWARSIPGIGPVIASGLLAHIDITKAPTAGHIWSFAGYNPAQVWEKGQKRPWNASLKRLGFLIGESFVKVQNNRRDTYGKVYAERKRLEQEANGYLFYAEQAAQILKTKRIGRDTDAYRAYSQGRLPPAHIHARAKRYAVKLFYAHLHDVWYEIEYKTAPPKPYVMEHLGHVDLLKPPNWPMKEGQETELAEEEVIQATPEFWPAGAKRERPPLKTLYLTLEAQISTFKEVLAHLEAPALGEVVRLPERIPELLSAYVPAAVTPTLEGRLLRYKAAQQREP